jgi:hypothetical protein
VTSTRSRSSGRTRNVQLAALRLLHADIVEEMPEWRDRVEVVYLSRHALESFRTGSSTAARISPGEPFHAIDVDRRWLIDWYQLRAVGTALCGPPVVSLVPVISGDEYVEAVRRHMLAWPDSAEALATQGDQSYAVLTLCRGLRTWTTGEHVSKREAARWASQAVPEHARLIRNAVTWRERFRSAPPIDGTATRDAVRRFVSDMKRLVEQAPPSVRGR